MVISHRHRYLYFVVPKCASATVRQSLAPFTDLGYPVTKGVQHQTIADFLESSNSALWDVGYRRFTFVRNPYDRLYSGFVQDKFAATQSERWRAAKAGIFERIGGDFGRYVQEYVSRADRLRAWDWICWCPMHAFAYRDGQLAMDFVGRAEDVGTSLEQLGKLLDFRVSKAADLNVNTLPVNGLKYLDKYNRATVNIVNEIYADDFRLFGYHMLDPAEFPDQVAFGVKP